MNATRILLVDNDPVMQSMAAGELRTEGYQVTAVARGDEALDSIRLLPPDLIIMEVNMPGMTGLALLKKLSSPDGKPRYPILIFTARSNMEQFFRSTGVAGFLTKESDPSRLIAEVKRILLKLQHPAPPPVSAGPKPKPVIVILEDEPLLNSRLKTSFNIAGYHTITLTDCHQLSDTLLSHTPAVILLKSVLPGTTGRDVAASLADYTSARRIKVILYDDSGIHPPTQTFTHINKFVPSSSPATLLKVVTSMLS